MKIEKNWWTYNSIWWIINGLYIVALGSLTGFLDVLVGVALLQKSNIVYWIVLVFTVFNFFGGLLSYSKDPFGFVLSLISFVFVYFLSKERSENKTKKFKK